MKLIFASDSFKGTVSSEETIRMLSQAAQEVFGSCDTYGVPVADGGEGNNRCGRSCEEGRKSLCQRSWTADGA